MGCYNTVAWLCPRCGERVSEQSKAGSCSLSLNTPQEAEIADVVEIANKPVTCPGCGTQSMIITYFDYYIKVVP